MKAKPPIHTEATFEAAIVADLIEHRGWVESRPEDFDRQLALVPKDRFAFVEATGGLPHLGEGDLRRGTGCRTFGMMYSSWYRAHGGADTMNQDSSVLTTTRRGTSIRNFLADASQGNSNGEHDE